MCAHRPIADLIPQGLPFCINGAGDLLALFRCISCKYKFSTDTAKPGLMGPGTLLALWPWPVPPAAAVAVPPARPPSNSAIGRPSTC